MDKNIVIIKNNNSKLTEYLIKYFKNKNYNLYCLDSAEECKDIHNIDLIILIEATEEFQVNEKIPVINIHPSLLPAFKEDEAVKKAFLSGVKVSGVTVHKVESNNFYGKILAQYPVLIGLDTHLDEFETDILKIEKKIYPVVIETILNNRVFDFHDLFRGKCSHSGGCSGNCCNK